MHDIGPPMNSAAKAAIVQGLVSEGYSESYGVLMHMMAVVGTGPGLLKAEDDYKRFEFHGCCKGLASALTCVAIHEANLDAKAAVTVVQGHIVDAIMILAQAADSE